MTYDEILKHYWGYDDFRGIQREIIESSDGAASTNSKSFISGDSIA